MSQEENKKLDKEKNININITNEGANVESNQGEIKYEILDINDELLAESFDFFEEESTRTKNLNIIEETIEEIKKENNEDNNFDEYIKNCIENLEEYSNILSFENLIYDPEYALKLLMRFLKKVIKFKYYFIKFNLPKDKIDHKEEKEKTQNTNENVISNSNQFGEGKNNKVTKTARTKKDKKEDTKNNNGKKYKEIRNEREEKKEGEKNEDNPNNEMNNFNGNADFKKGNKIKNKNILEKKKDDFFLKLSLKEKKGIVSQQFNENNNKPDTKKIEGKLENDKSKKKSKISISSSVTSKEKSSTLRKEKSDANNDETLLKLEEYKLMNFDNILSIINNNANTEEEDFIPGKNFESKVRKYFQVILDICSDKYLSVYKSSGISIEGLYKYYDDIIEKDKTKKNNNISDISKRKNVYNKIEFDLIVDNVGKNILDKIIDIFGSNIIAKNLEENSVQANNYQIVGKVAKNILNQSIDKFKQIQKIIDVLLIEQYLTSKSLENLDNSILYELIKEYDCLKLDINTNKIIFIFTNGSFVELKNALLYKDSDFEKVNNDYESVQIKSIFPIKNKRRYCKNIIYLKKIVESLNASKIPFIIFYVGEELNNDIERVLINYIKKQNNDSYKSIISKINNNNELVSKSISQYSSIKTIGINLKKLNKNVIFEIIKNIANFPDNLMDDYFNFLYKNLIENTKLEKKYYILLFFFNDLTIPKPFAKRIKDFNNNNHLTQIEINNITEEDFLSKYSKYKDKNIYKVFLITKKKQSNDIKDFEISNLEVKDFRNLNDINFEKINNDKIKEIITKYILSNFSRFSEELYLNLNILHKKIIFDIKNLEKDLPIKSKEIEEDKIFVEKARILFDKCISDDIIKEKSDEILENIKNCLGKKLYQYFFGAREEYIKKKLKINLKRITEHISCFSIYEKFFMEYLSLEIE